MESKPLDIALSFYKIAVPIFGSLKQEMKSVEKKGNSHPVVKELTFTQLRVLLAIEYGKDQVGKLARAAKVAQPAMSKIVNHLIGIGFVSGEHDRDDRRQIKLQLTAKGAAMTHRVRLKASEKYVEAIKNLSEKDRKKMIEGIAVILDVIEKTKKENP